MQWSPDKNAGFSRANPQSLYLPVILDPSYHYEANNVETQLASPHSLLWCMRRLLALRKRWRALGEGRCEFLQPENRKVLSYLLRYQHETLLVVANLSRFAQPVELDLAAFQHLAPVELFGRMRFPPIGERPYSLSLGPHAFYWFSLEPQAARHALAAGGESAPPCPRLTASGPWPEALGPKTQAALEAVLPDFLRRQPWFDGRSQTIRQVSVKDTLVLPVEGGEAVLLARAQVDYVEGEAATYALPLALATGPAAVQVREACPGVVLAEFTGETPLPSGLLFDALASPAFSQALLRLAWHRQRLSGPQGHLEGVRTPVLRRLMGEAELAALEPGGLAPRHTWVFFGDRLTLKFFRRLEPGAHPALELGQFLTAQGLPHAPALAGALEYRTGDEGTVLAVLHEAVPNAKGARHYTLDALGRYFDRVGTWVAEGRPAPNPPAEPASLLEGESPPDAAQGIGTYLEAARLLGSRLAQLHLSLASAPEGDPLAPEPVTPHYLRGVFQSMRSRAVEHVRGLRRQLKGLGAEVLPLAQRVVELLPAIVERYRRFYEQGFAARRIRIHGNCQLDQALWTGKDFVFIDFEGDPTLPLGERCIKRSPLRDVATLLRSLHRTAYAGLAAQVERGSIPESNLARFEPWVRYWNRWVGAALLRAYLPTLAKAGLLPAQEAALRGLLQAYLLHQLVAELGQELNQPTGQLKVTLKGLLHLLEEATSALPHPPASEAPEPGGPKEAPPAPPAPARRRGGRPGGAAAKPHGSRPNRPRLQPLAHPSTLAPVRRLPPHLGLRRNRARNQTLPTPYEPSP